MKIKVLITMMALLILALSMPSASAETVDWSNTTSMSFIGFDIVLGFNISDNTTYPVNKPTYVMITNNNIMDFPASGAVDNQDWSVSFSKEFNIEDGFLNVHNFTANRPSVKKKESIIIKFEKR